MFSTVGTFVARRIYLCCMTLVWDDVKVCTWDVLIHLFYAVTVIEKYAYRRMMYVAGLVAVGFALQI